MSMNKSLGKNLGWFWNEWFFTTYTLDQSIQAVTKEGSNGVIEVYDKGDMVMPVIAKVEFTDSTTETVTAPAEVWFGGMRRTRLTVPLRGRTIKSVTLDPENRFQDIDRKNNVWPAS
jgi:hypothetical protein